MFYKMIIQNVQMTVQCLRMIFPNHLIKFTNDFNSYKIGFYSLSNDLQILSGDFVK